MTAPTKPINYHALDEAWRAYHHGSTHAGAAIARMREAGVTVVEAEGILLANEPPSARTTDRPRHRTVKGHP